MVEPAMRAGALDPSPGVWTDADVARYLDRRARLLRWGWTEVDADRLAERLALRDLDDRDDRVACIDCRSYRPCRCGNHRAAGLHAPDVARDLAELLQRCPGHERIGPER